MPQSFRSSLPRRAFLKRSLGAALAGLMPRAILLADDGHGTIKPPRLVPDLTVRCQDGRSVPLRTLASGRVTAVQLMFTTCTTTCPMQGATFERVQRLLPEMKRQRLQLLSLSVDPKRDTPEALTEWLGMFHAGSSWIGSAPAIADLEAVKAFFGAGQNALDPHSTQTHIVNGAGKLVFRTGELPPPEQIAELLRSVRAAEPLS